MKTNVLFSTIILSLSLSAFAQVTEGDGPGNNFRLDLGRSNYKENLVANFSKTYLKVPQHKYGNFIQNKKIRSTSKVSIHASWCIIADTDEISRINAIPLENMKAEIDRVSGRTNFLYNGALKITCNGRSSNPTSLLTKHFETEVKKEVFVKDVLKKKVTFLGVTNEANPSALVNVNGREELLDCSDLMLSSARNGDLISGYTVLHNQMNELVTIIAIGEKYARVENSEEKLDISIDELSPVYHPGKLKLNEKVYISVSGKKESAIVKGALKVDGKELILVEQNKSLLTVEKDQIIKINKI